MYLFGNRLKDIILIFISILFGSFGQLSLKYGMNIVGYIKFDKYIFYSLLKTLINVYIIIGLLMYMISALIWLIVLSRVKLSLAYPIVSLGYIFTILLSLFILNENIPLTRWFGLIIILVGIYFVIIK